MKKIVLFFLLVTSSVFASGQQIDFLLSGFRNPLDDSFLSGGLVYTYAAGTTASKSVYTNAALTTASTNPVVLDAYGRALRFASGKYKFIIKTSGGTILWTLDNLEYGSLTTLASTTTNPFGPTMKVTNFSTPNLTATLAADLNCGGYALHNIATPTLQYDAVNMTYVSSETSYYTLVASQALATVSNTLTTRIASDEAALASVTLNLTNYTASLTFATPTTTSSTTWEFTDYNLSVSSATWIPLTNFVYTNSLTETVYLHVTMQGDFYAVIASAGIDDISVSCTLAMKDNVSLVNYASCYPTFHSSSTLFSAKIPFQLTANVPVSAGETKTLNLSYALFEGDSGVVSLMKDSRWVSWFRIK